ncbi:UNKNOWN [Stylonychia lemnae]|uniref:Uncharacterized protein n=1 Tax=Stylonychia lemnae TaxID=5949 RepID=A0A078B157_STYLE|nr:UNKNOWN [Stylonychia lemnae]|eukprot:CDW88294.1 UNKNOWN [Stylonychia lemnae]
MTQLLTQQPHSSNNNFQTQNNWPNSHPNLDGVKLINDISDDYNPQLIDQLSRAGNNGVSSRFSMPLKLNNIKSNNKIMMLVAQDQFSQKAIQQKYKILETLDKA